MSQPHAVIIAGGKGERLGGVRKAELKIGGRRLIDRVASALAPAAPPLLVATGHGTLVLPPGATAVQDLNDTLEGPLAGLAAAVDWLSHQGITGGLLVSAAVDTPFFPASFISTMTAALESHAAAYARWGDEFYPPHAIWRLAAIADLPERVRTGTAPRSLKALLAEIAGQPVDWRALAGANPFENLNELADLVRLGARART